MGLLFGSAGGHTYLKSGQVAPPPPDANSFFLPGVPKKNAHRLIWCKLKRTVFTRSTFLFSESPYLHLKFGMKQSKICGKSVKGWITKPKISGPRDEQMTQCFRKMH